MTAWTADTFGNGRLHVRQARNGYRFSIDAVLLAHSVRLPDAGTRILDLGTGCGIIPLILALRCPAVRIIGIEIQAELAALAQHNVRRNDLQDRIEILAADLCRLPLRGRRAGIDLVVTNPPYRRADTGRVNPDIQRAIARHELKTTLADIVAAADGLLGRGGRFAAVYPAERLADMLVTLRRHQLEPKALRMVHSGGQTPAKLFVVEAVKGGKPGLKVAAPLVIYNADGAYTPEVAAMLR